DHVPRADHALRLRRRGLRAPDQSVRARAPLLRALPRSGAGAGPLPARRRDPERDRAAARLSARIALPARAAAVRPGAAAARARRLRPAERVRPQRGDRRGGRTGRARAARGAARPARRAGRRRLMAADIAFLTAVELREAYAARTLSPVEVVDALAGRIDALDPLLGAFYTLTVDTARAEAAAAESAWARG